MLNFHTLTDQHLDYYSSHFELSLSAAQDLSHQILQCLSAGSADIMFEDTLYETSGRSLVVTVISRNLTHPVNVSVSSEASNGESSD